MRFFRSATPAEKLISGYRRFRREFFRRERNTYRRLALKGQRPRAMILACSDSRVSPTTIFTAHPGDVFIARNIANIAPPYDPDAKPRSVGAALEYAVKVLKVSDIVVLGHARCGGVQALLSNGKGLPASDYLLPWVEVAAPARDLCPTNLDSMSEVDRALCCEQAVIQVSLNNMIGYPWIGERLRRDELRLHGWHFDILHGALSRFDRETSSFVTVQ
jgi:carbonic anhydrase